jgi:hypothetical protein
MPKPVSPMEAYKGPAMPKPSGIKTMDPAPSVRSFGLQLVVQLAVKGAVNVVSHLLGGKGTSCPEGATGCPPESRLEELMEANVAPKIKTAMEMHAAEALRLTTEDPSFPVYANVTINVQYEKYDESEVDDVSFVDLQVSRARLDKKTLLSAPWARKEERVTFSSEISFGETEAEHHWRVLVHDAAQAAKRGMSARSYAESTHFGGKGLKPWEEREDEKRRQRGELPLAVQRTREERILWVRAYIAYTGQNGPYDQYVAAQAYLEELLRPREPKTLSSSEREAQKLEIDRLEWAISQSWRFQDALLESDARRAIEGTPLQRRLREMRWESNQHRWAYIRYYLQMYSTALGKPLNDAQLLHAVAIEEYIYVYG